MMWTPVQEALAEFAATIQYGYNDENWAEWTHDIAETYRLFAGFIGARPEEIVGIPNTSTGWPRLP